MRKTAFLLLFFIAVLSGCTANTISSETTSSSGISDESVAYSTNDFSDSVSSASTVSAQPTEPFETEEPFDIAEFSEQLEIAENVITKATALYSTLYSYDRTNLQREELTSEQIEALNFDSQRMYYRVTDERFNTWDKLMSSLSECFSENAIQYFQDNSPNTYFEFDNQVYAVYGDAGFIGADKIELTRITPLTDDSFMVSFKCYMLDEIAADTYRCYADIDTQFTKSDTCWVLDSSSDWQNGREELFYCGNIKFKAD